MKSLFKYAFLLISILTFIHLGFYLWGTDQNVLAIISLIIGASISITGYYITTVKPFKENWGSVMSEIEHLEFEEASGRENIPFIKSQMSESELFNGDGIHIGKFWENDSNNCNHYFGRYTMSSNLSQGTFYIISQEKQLPDCTFICSQNHLSRSLEDSIDVIGEKGYQFLSGLSDSTRKLWSEIPFADIRFRENYIICYYRIGKENHFSKLYSLIPKLIEDIS